MSKTRIISMTVLFVGAIILTACGGQQDTGIPTFDCLGSADEALVDLECEEITVAVENLYLPFNYILSETGQAAGWDYEVIPEICERLHCQPVFVEVAWEVMIQSVADGLYSMAGDGITINDERDEIVDFSSGYIQVQQRLLVRIGEDRFTSIEEFVEISELVMGTQSVTTNYDTAVEYLPEERISAFETFPFAVQALVSGDVDAVIIDGVAGLGYQGEHANELDLIGPSISSDSLGFVFSNGSDLVEPFNAALAAMEADGFMEDVNTRYFIDFAVGGDDIEDVTYDD